MRKFFHYAGNIAVMFLAFVIYTLLEEFYFYPQLIHLRYHIPNQAFVTAVLTVLVMGFLFWLYKKELREVNYWGFNKEPHWDAKRLGIAVIGFFLIFFLGAITLTLVNRGGHDISSNQAALNQLADRNTGLFKIMVGFVGPFCEEIIFRGMFFNTFFTKATRFNKWIGILVCGFLFAYVHDPMITKYIVVYWVLGCVLSWVYLTTKDLRYSMITHMAYNCIGLF